MKSIRLSYILQNSVKHFIPVKLNGFSGEILPQKYFSVTKVPEAQLGGRMHFVEMPAAAHRAEPVFLLRSQLFPHSVEDTYKIRAGLSNLRICIRRRLQALM